MADKVVTNLCIIHKHPKILLGLKKRRFGEGLWNGFGGKVDTDESVESSLIRELKEEVGLEPINMEKRGLLNFEFESGSAPMEIHLFYMTEFKGEPEETEEMSPQWFHVDKIPFHQMWPEDAYWMPLLLAGKKFKGKFILDKPSNSTHISKIVSNELSEVEDL